MLSKTCDHFKAAMVKAQQAERAWHNWYTQQSSTKATTPMAPSPIYQGPDKMPTWAKAASPAAPATPVGGVLRSNPVQAAVQTKPKAVIPVKAKLPCCKRALQTNVEDELPSWARGEPEQQTFAAAASTPILVTKPAVKVAQKPTEWVDKPEPQMWERFLSKSIAAYSLYRPAPNEQLMPLDADGMSTIGPSPSAAPSVVAESLSSWINVPSQIAEQAAEQP
eukprot:6473954-Amphidinium_carterae.1